MKTKLIAGLVASCFAAPALAQSNITIYGIVDAGIHVSSNGEGTRTKLVSGIADGSRLGFKGTEDMGGGYKTIFNLESRVELDTGGNQAGNISDNEGLALPRGLNFIPVLSAATAPTVRAGVAAAVAAQAQAGGATADQAAAIGAGYVASAAGIADVANRTAAAVAPTGAKLLAGSQSALRQAGALKLVNFSGALFDRTAMVGMITPVGAVLAGRMYTPGYEVFAAADTFETGTAGTWGGITGGSGGLLTAGIAIRSSRSVQYRIQLPSGISAALMYGFKNSGYIDLDKRFYAANVMYKANGLNVGLGYNNGQDQNGNSGLISTILGGSYETGPFKFFAGYLNQRNENSVVVPLLTSLTWDAGIAPTLTAQPAALQSALRNSYINTLKQNFKLNADSYSLGMHYNTGNGRVMGSVSRQNDKTASNNDATQYAIGYDHNLSKRTDIYTVLAYIKNDNNAQYAPGAASAPGGFTTSGGVSGKAFQIGMRHRF
ncbi:MAG: porin [Glaciimonas sp.]|nr:porin [Glaciimonas sp.]